MDIVELLLSGATPEQVAKVKAEVAATEAKLAKLKAALTVIAPNEASNTRWLARDGRRVRPTPTKDKQRQRIFDCLAASEPRFPAEISELTGVPRGSVYAILKHPFFENTDSGWTLSSEARASLNHQTEPAEA